MINVNSEKIIYELSNQYQVFEKYSLQSFCSSHLILMPIWAPFLILVNNTVWLLCHTGRHELVDVALGYKVPPMGLICIFQWETRQYHQGFQFRFPGGGGGVLFKRDNLIDECE